MGTFLAAKVIPTTCLTVLSEIDVGMPTTWDPTFGEFLQSAYQSYPKNLDHNSGNPIGVGICQHSTYDGRRVTASEAFLNRRPANLTVLAGHAVSKVIIRGKKAVGVEMINQGGRFVWSRIIDWSLNFLYHRNIRKSRSYPISRSHRLSQVALAFWYRSRRRIATAWALHCS